MSHQFNHLLENIGAYPDFVALELPEDYKNRQVERPQGSLQLQAQAFSLSIYGELRAVIIHSHKIDIISCFFYPYPEWHLPIYAMEFVSLGKKPIIGVLDLPCLSGEHLAAQHLMQQLQTEYNFVHSTDYPLWYQECRSGYDIFVRPHNSAVFDLLAKAHTQLISHLPTLAKNAQRLPTSAINQHQNHLSAYRHHHLVNSPGLPLMNNIFGEIWTMQFLQEWFFSNLERKSEIML